MRLRRLDVHPVVSKAVLVCALASSGCGSAPQPATIARPATPPVRAPAEERCRVDVDRDSSTTVVTDTVHGFAIAVPGNGYVTRCVPNGNELLVASREDLGFRADVTLDRVPEGAAFDAARYLDALYDAIVARFRGSAFHVGSRGTPPEEAGTTLVYSVESEENGVATTSLSAWHVLTLPQGYVLRHHVTWSLPRNDATPEHSEVVAVTASLFRVVPSAP